MSARGRLVELEAAGYLLAARAAIRLVPFRWLRRMLERAPRRSALRGEDRGRARAEVRRAIFGVSRRLPGRTVCFPKAVAAQAMLRRRGVGTTLYCGVSTSSEQPLTTHVWLCDGEHPVTGVWQSRDYRALASYPPGPPGSGAA